MKSIQFKFLSIVLSSILLVAIVTTVIGFAYMSKMLDTDSDIITDSVANTEALRINDYFHEVENTVTTMENYIKLTLRGQVDVLKDETQRREYEKTASSAFYAPMNTVHGIVGFYLRFEPELVEDEYAGFYAGKANFDAAQFVEKDPAELTGWSGEEWYSLPAKNGVPIWLSPYICFDSDDGLEIISYVAPIFVDNVFIGVAGVDVSFEYVTDMVGNISVYDNGFAYLSEGETDGELGEIIFSPDEHLLNRATQHKHKFAEEHEILENGMILVIHADYSDIQRGSYRMIMTNIFVVLICLSVFIILTYVLTKKIVHPLKDLTEAAEVLAEGKTDLKLENCKTNDEIGVLATAFEKTAKKLQGYMNYINGLAYRDALTGVKNLAAYKEMATKLELKMGSGEQEPFAILVLDINGLKKTNDRYGHEIGNRLIVRATKLICNIFKHSPVFRVGGDEFIVLLEGEDLENREALIAELDESCMQTFVSAGEETIAVSVARGIEYFDRNVDTRIEDILNRADKKMYEHKNLLKQKK